MERNREIDSETEGKEKKGKNGERERERSAHSSIEQIVYLVGIQINVLLLCFRR